ncbi:S1 family peptidase [Vibrio sp. 3-2(1)]|uniref:S1 family peptidase n=1 Tax=Vibrio sp. 3-2(1) TaxID=2591016 RepID=UPI00148303DF|nr:trypsin-like serine protease [Vibrio sp. 3-2(1)]NNN68890.1 trypsin-like serine protease [Vibrio sp. 3-2(1)]
MNKPLFSVALGALLFTSFQFSASGTESGISTRIINGTPADAGNFPFMVALHYSTLKSSFCGGSYLGNKYVLTAAHCVAGKNPLNAEDIEVTVGAYDLRTNSGRRVKVKQIYYHEAYDDKDHPGYTEKFNDIAILELERALPIQAIKRPNTGDFDSIAVGSILEIIGFGTTKYSQWLNKSSNPSSLLRKAEVSLMDTAACKALGGSDYPRIGNDAFCTSSFPQDACQGDSGGPIFVKEGDDFIQYGVISWGRGCGLAGAASVYSKVDYFNDWLDQRTSGVSFRQSQYQSEIKYGTYTHRFHFVNGSTESITAQDVKISPVSADITGQNCTLEPTLASNSQCYIDVSYTIDSMTPADVSLGITTRNLGTITSSLKFISVLEPASPELSGMITVPNNGISVNVNPWIEEDGWLRSARMDDTARSVLLLENVPKGNISFDFQVSSTFNDSLIVKVSGTTLAIENGEYSGSRTLYLDDEVNDIRFEYVKTSSTPTGSDAAYIKNLKYEKPYSFTLPPLSGGSGGGSTGGMTLLSMLAALLIRRRYLSH